ncbi:hypothetical protein AVEN_49476-1 [Araneus ventricosus]|uniref:Uncharacterized protein n=1 Tax=Araneus ventricosus TaxID=182803 RepID=A0A4Y2NLY7_ARAVE|nr:hypothetical protein AVEN_49476-1 [Araneus ventricosus]
MVKSLSSGLGLQQTLKKFRLVHILWTLLRPQDCCALGHGLGCPYERSGPCHVNQTNTYGESSVEWVSSPRSSDTEAQTTINLQLKEMLLIV